MIVEREIEGLLIDKFKTMVEDDDIQVVGTWQSVENVVRGIEEDTTGYLIIKVNPRSYDTPTIPTSTIEVNLSLMMRADIDTSGDKYFSIVERIIGKLECWQKDINEYVQDFYFDGYDPSGFRLDTGSNSMDSSATTWNYTQSFTLYGVIS